MSTIAPGDSVPGEDVDAAAAAQIRVTHAHAKTTGSIPAAATASAAGDASTDTGGDTVKVAVRCRPILASEHGTDPCVKVQGQRVTIADNFAHAEKSFNFDAAFGSDTPQQDVYGAFGPQMVAHVCAGYNVSVLAYGQTGSGKSFTMFGSGGAETADGNSGDESRGNAGFIPRLCSELFQRISTTAPGEGEECMHRVEAAYFQIYNERVFDLLAVDGMHGASGGAAAMPTRSASLDLDGASGAATASRLRVREHPETGPFVEGLSWHAVDSYGAIERLIADGNLFRAVAATNMNATSSRSHAIVTLRYTQTRIHKETNAVSDLSSKVSLIDLAGSERVGKTGAEGQRLKEAGSINKSLTSLGIVIAALAQRSEGIIASTAHVPYRDSVLTWLLKDSLGGNAKTLMIATISPSDSNFDESLSTLRYADRAKRIRNKAVVNEDPNAALIRQLREELMAVKAQLAALREAAQGSTEKVVFVDNPALVAEIESLRVQNAFQDRLLKQMNVEWDARLKATADGVQAREEAFRAMGIVSPRETTSAPGHMRNRSAFDVDDEGSSVMQGGGQLDAASAGQHDHSSAWEEGEWGGPGERNDIDGSSADLHSHAGGQLDEDSRTAAHDAAAPSRNSRPHLILLHPDAMINRRMKCPLRQGDTRIGSEADNDIRLAGNGVGGHHCVISHYEELPELIAPAESSLSPPRLELLVEAGCVVFVNGTRVALTAGGSLAASDDAPALAAQHHHDARERRISAGTNTGSDDDADGSLFATAVLKHGDRIVLGDDRHVFLLVVPHIANAGVSPAMPLSPSGAMQHWSWQAAVDEVHAHTATPVPGRSESVAESEASTAMEDPACRTAMQDIAVDDATENAGATGEDAMSDGEFAQLDAFMQLEPTRDTPSTTHAPTASSSTAVSTSPGAAEGKPVQETEGHTVSQADARAEPEGSEGSSTGMCAPPGMSPRKLRVVRAASEVHAPLPVLSPVASTAMAVIRRRHARHFEHILMEWTENAFISAISAPLELLASGTAEANAVARALGSRYRFSRRALWVPVPASPTGESVSAPMLLDEASVASPGRFAVGVSLWKLPASGDPSHAVPCGLVYAADMLRLMPVLRCAYHGALEGRTQAAVDAAMQRVWPAAVAADTSRRSLVQVDPLLMFHGAATSEYSVVGRGVVPTHSLLPRTSASNELLDVPVTSPWGERAGSMVVDLRWELDGEIGCVRPQLHICEVALGTPRPPNAANTRPETTAAALDVTIFWHSVAPALAPVDEMPPISHWYRAAIGSVSLTLKEDAAGCFAAADPAGQPAGSSAAPPAALTADDLTLLSAGGIAFEIRARLSRTTELIADAARVASSSLAIAPVKFLTAAQAQRSGRDAGFITDLVLDAHTELQQMQLNVLLDMQSCAATTVTSASGETPHTDSPAYYPVEMKLKPRDATGGTTAGQEGPASRGVMATVTKLLRGRAATSASSVANTEPSFTLDLPVAQKPEPVAGGSARTQSEGGRVALAAPPNTMQRLVAAVHQLADGSPFGLESVGNVRLTDLRYVQVSAGAASAADLPFDTSLSAPDDGATETMAVDQHRDPSGRCLRFSCNLHSATLRTRPSVLLRALAYCLENPTLPGYRIYARLQISVNVRGSLLPVAFARWISFKVRPGKPAESVAQSFMRMVTGADPRVAGLGTVPGAHSSIDDWYASINRRDAVQRVHALTRRCLVSVDHRWREAGLSEDGVATADAEHAAHELAQVGLRHASGLLRSSSVLSSTPATTSTPRNLTSPKDGAQFTDVSDMLMPPLAASVRLPRCDTIDVKRGSTDRSGYLMKKAAHVGSWLRRWYVLRVPFLTTYHTAADSDSGAAPKAVLHLHQASVRDERGLLGIEPLHGGAVRVVAIQPTGATNPLQAASTRRIPVPGRDVTSGPLSPGSPGSAYGFGRETAAASTLCFDVSVPGTGAGLSPAPGADGDADAAHGIVTWHLQANNMEEKEAWICAILSAARMVPTGVLY